MTTRFDSTATGTFFGVLSALAYTGANMALRKLAFRGDADWAVWVSCNKAVPAALVAWTLIGYRAWRGLPALPPRHVIKWLLLTGLFMQFAGNVMFQWSLSLVGLAMTVPLMFSVLIVSGACLGRWFLGEAITRRSTAAMGLLIASIVLLSAGAEGSVLPSIGRASLLTVAGATLAACTAGLAYGTCGVVIRGMLTREHSLSATLVLLSTTGVIGLGVLSLARLGFDQLAQTLPADFGVMMVAGSLNAVAFFSVAAAMRHISVVRTNLLNASQVALCAMAGIVWFDEKLTVWVLGGMVFTVVGLLLMDRRKEPRRSVKAAVPADQQPAR